MEDYVVGRVVGVVLALLALVEMEALLVAVLESLHWPGLLAIPISLVAFGLLLTAAWAALRKRHDPAIVSSNTPLPELPDTDTQNECK